jgi:hypothetical protein
MLNAGVVPPVLLDNAEIFVPPATANTGNTTDPDSISSYVVYNGLSVSGMFDGGDSV